MTTVNHPTFGKGQIVNQDDNNVTVDFNGNIKTLVIKFSKLTNEDGSPFGVQAIATNKKKKKTSAEKRMEWERTLTEDQKRELRFENPDGSRNEDAYWKFIDEQDKKKWASKSW
jgi:hypothetical protein